MGVSPLYSIHQYTDEVYKVVAFKGVRDLDLAHVRDQENERRYDTKLNEAFCRVKSMVLQYALCTLLVRWMKLNLTDTIWTHISKSFLSLSGTSASLTARRCNIF